MDVYEIAAQCYPHLIKPPFDEIYEHCGYDCVKFLVQAYYGDTIYIPSLRYVLSDCIDMAIASQCGTLSARKISQMYGVSTKHVKKLIHNS